MTMPRLQLGIAGLGRGFMLLLPTLAAHPGIRLVAAADPREDARRQFTADFAAATYNFSILEFVPHEEGRRSEFVMEPWIPKDGYLDIPDKPGWGIAVNEDALSKYPYQPYRRPNARRADGSPALI